MGYKLCIAEKPSVGRDIANVLGAAEKHPGYMEGNGYIVTWAIGHLVTLAQPEAYGYMSQAQMYSKDNPGAAQAAKAQLPLFPQAFMTEVIDSTKEQFDIVRGLMHRSDVDLIIDCGDMGPEGHYLQWLIREKAGCIKPVKRFCATSMTDEAIKGAFLKLRDINEFDGVILGEWCKHRADWSFGMSMSRAASLKYRARVDVGRVQSPTLFFVVKRYTDCMNFKPHDFYTLSASFSNGLSASWEKDTAGIFENIFKDSENRLTDRGQANALRAKLAAEESAEVTLLETKQKSTERPKLYDITELMRDANKIYGYGAEDTLKTAQSLYETHKVLSYPRTDSRFITSDLVPYMSDRIEMISGLERYAAAACTVIETGLNIDANVVNDSKVTDHHALIVTEKIKGFNINALQEKESNVLHLVITRMIEAFSQKYIYNETKTEVTIGDEPTVTFSATGKTVVQKGFKALREALRGKEDAENENEGKELPPLEQGMTLSITGIDIAEKKTAPPQLHTEATLLGAMENAGAHIEGGEILKGRGIGTQATRAGIIKKLFEKGYIEEKGSGKQKKLHPTKQGLSVIKAIPAPCYTPKITADWEEMIAKIADGEMNEENFFNNFKAFLEEQMNALEAADVKTVDFSAPKTPLGICPWCKAGVHSREFEKDGRKLRFYPCDNKECGFALYADYKYYLDKTGKTLTEENIKKLLEKGRISATCNKSDGSGTYRADFILGKYEAEGRRPAATLNMELSKAKQGKVKAKK